MAQTNGGDPSSYIWSCKVTLEETLWACLDESLHGIRAFDASYSNSKVSITFPPSSEMGWLPPSLALLISELQYCFSLSPRNLMPDWLFLGKPCGFKGHKSPLITWIHLKIWDQINSWLRSIQVTSGINPIVPLDMYKLASVARTAIMERAFAFQLPEP